MSAISKHFLEFSKHRTCADFCHPNETCTQQLIDMLLKNSFGTGRFYLPTLVIPLVLKMKLLNRDMIFKALIDYGKCILIANWLGIGSITSVCLYHKIFGKFYFPYFIRVPSAFGTLMFQFYPERIKQWQAIGLLNMYIETIIRISDNRIVKILRKSRMFGTAMFMVFSGIIMTGFKITGMKRFWFTSMPELTKDNSQTSKILKHCDHYGPCTAYIWKEFIKSTQLAVILGLLNFIVSNFRRIKLTQLSSAVKMLAQKLDYNMMAFTLCYNTLFKLLHCCFNNTAGENNVANTMVAGFLSGITYSLYPIYMTFTYGLTASFQMGWSMYTKYILSRVKNLKNDHSMAGFIRSSRRFIDFVNKLPIATIMMSFSIIQLSHLRFQYPYATPLYVHNFMSVGTGKRVDRAGSQISEFLLGFGSA